MATVLHLDALTLVTRLHLLALCQLAARLFALRPRVVRLDAGYRGLKLIIKLLEEEAEERPDISVPPSPQ